MHSKPRLNLLLKPHLRRKNRRRSTLPRRRKRSRRRRWNQQNLRVSNLLHKRKSSPCRSAGGGFSFCGSRHAILSWNFRLQWSGNNETFSHASPEAKSAVPASIAWIGERKVSITRL